MRIDLNGDRGAREIFLDVMTTCLLVVVWNIALAETVQIQVFKCVGVSGAILVERRVRLCA